MKLEEATKVLYVLSIEYTGRAATKEYDALRLGIEALSYIDTCQKNPNCFNISLLPGQTPG